MSKYPKVLVGIVTYEGKDYIWDKFINNIKSLTYPNFDVMIVDNTKDKKYYNKLNRRLKDTDIIIKHVNRGDTSREAQARSLNTIRDYFLENNYDYFMSIESDLIPPRDIIQRLMRHNKLVVGTIYLIGFHYSKTQPPRPCLFSVRKKKNGSGEMETYNIPNGFDYFGNGLVKIHGCGIGCVLIDKSILQKVKFWYHLDPPVKHSDVLFYMDLHNMGIPVYIDSDLIIPHHNSDWKDVADK